MISIKTPRK